MPDPLFAVQVFSDAEVTAAQRDHHARSMGLIMRCSTSEKAIRKSRSVKSKLTPNMRAHLRSDHGLLSLPDLLDERARQNEQLAEEKKAKTAQAAAEKVRQAVA